MGYVGRVACVGIDLGTSTIKVSFGTTQLRFPSVIGEPRPGFRGITEDTSWINNLVIRIGDQEWYVGELARLQSPVKRWLAREGLVKSPQDAIVGIKAALSLVLPPGEHYVAVATGVPVGTGQRVMQELGKSILGVHDISVRNEATGESKNLRVRIVIAPVLPEPYGAYIYMLKKLGETKARDCFIIDIGYGSTDFLAIYKGRILGTASGSIREAVDTLAVRLADYISEQTGRFLDPESLMPVIESEKKQVTIAGKVYDITKQVEQLARYIANIIVDRLEGFLDRLPPDAMIRYYLLVGGGAYIFGKHIRNIMLERKLIQKPEQLVVPPDPVQANAMGFELVAEHFARKQLGVK